METEIFVALSSPSGGLYLGEGFLPDIYLVNICAYQKVDTSPM